MNNEIIKGKNRNDKLNQKRSTEEEQINKGKASLKKRKRRTPLPNVKNQNKKKI